MTKRLFNILCLSVVMLMSLSLGSCVDDLLMNDAGGDEIIVEFNLLPEAASTCMRSRAGENPFLNKTISDGSTADMLIFAVYDDKDNLLEEYSQGTDNELRQLGFDHGDGQTIKKVGDGFPYTLRISLKRGEKYKIAFWAQSSKSKAYDTSDLLKVEVIYGTLGDDETDDNGNKKNPDGVISLNNDEDRDVFCRTVELTASASTGNIQQNVYLYRPLAQINVGTSGYDYEVITRNATKRYTHSKIRINRVARYLDVVHDRTYDSTTGESGKTPEAFSVVDFDYAPIPSYIFNESPKIPDYPSYTEWDWIYNGNDFDPDGTGATRQDYKNEQFLKVSVRDSKANGNFTPDSDEDKYADYANFNNYMDYDSETFKYLSMCYVLTSSSDENAVVINNVKVWLATDADGSDETNILDIDHVPAQRNWRTNIVGNLLTESNVFSISLDKDFAGDYNTWKAGDDWEASGPLADGVYYDAANDVIEISNVAGLIWFQRMVNGDLTKRDTPKRYWNDARYGVGRNYWYNDGSGYKQLLYKGIEKPKDKTLMKRILRATHQDMNTNVTSTTYDNVDPDGWPVGNRFHFLGYYKGSDGKTYETRAHVKLVADIDLTGIEWIPIGFEAKTIDQMNMHGYGSSDNLSYPASMSQSFNRTSEQGAFSAKNSNPHIRGFWGEFDGNNHTISNLSTKRFGVSVMDWEPERGAAHTAPSPDGRMFGADYRYCDALPWFGRGLFGQLMSNAKIQNLRLYNVDIKGCNGVGGIAGIAYGDSIDITNCVVDGGMIAATPMYRGDTCHEGLEIENKNRTFARGVNTGGIVGSFNTRYGSVDNCQVRNLTIQGYRRVGGLIGSADLASNEDSSVDMKYSRSKPRSISYNTVSNVTIIGTMFAPFTYVTAEYDAVNKVEKTGMGYTDSKYNLNMQKFVGGDSRDYILKNASTCVGNFDNDIMFAEMRINYDQDPNYPGLRVSTIQKVPLVMMPLLSSWYVDIVTLSENYYGHAGAKKVQQLHNDFYHLSLTKDTKYWYPLSLPNDVEITWMKGQTANVGLYVESTDITGGGVGNRSVITPDNVSGDGSAVMYVTARDHKSYWDNLNYKSTEWYRKDTKINNFVLRGTPYAYAGMLLAPNENMKSVQLNNVAIYDVFKTIALDDAFGVGNYWPNKKPDPKDSELILTSCNLRGYTVPGAGWKKITYNKTTFERGTNTGHDELEFTYQVENSNTNFNSCYFKAPYIIDLTQKGSAEINFNSCYASATSVYNVDIDPQKAKTASRILIRSNSQGMPVVTYETASAPGARKARR